MDVANGAAEASSNLSLFNRTKDRINKLPSIKRPTLVYKTGRKKSISLRRADILSTIIEIKASLIELSMRLGKSSVKTECGPKQKFMLCQKFRQTKTKKISERISQKVFIEKEFRCFFCDELCDIEYLECKVCPKLFHTLCLYRRGHLNNIKVPLKLEWTCYDCSDLSKLLTDEEIRKIINIYDQLDFRKNCYVNFDDYMDIKRKMYLEDGETMTKEREVMEKARFRLIDRDRSGTITWSEFVEFEAADLLSKKNKIELSNSLSMKELLVAKKKFLSYDKDDTKMIDKHEAKSCYIEFIDKLRRKLGPAFGAHLSNCADLFGLDPKLDIVTNTAKTIWPEFIRKLTILLLYDRKNFSVFEPRYWKPGIWYSILNRPNNSYLLDRENSNLPLLKPHAQQPNKVTPPKPNDQFQVEQLMSNKFDMSKFKPHKLSEFGSIELTIRSKSRHSYDDLISTSEIDWNHIDSVKKLKSSLTMNKSKHLAESLPGSLTRSETQKDCGGGQVSFDEYKYDLVSKTIYEKFGREKQFCDYPQKIPQQTPRQHKFPDIKRLRANKMRKNWESEQELRKRSVNSGADFKFLEKITSSKDFSM